jgi:hypothetical protein
MMALVSMLLLFYFDWLDCSKQHHKDSKRTPETARLFGVRWDCERYGDVSPTPTVG